MQTNLSRRRLIGRAAAGAGAVALASLCPSLLGLMEEDEQVVPFVDPQPIDPKRPMLKWEDLHDWISPLDQFFAVSHYGTAKISFDSWKLKLEGLVEKPVELSLGELKARPRREVTATLECSGNGAGPGFMGAIGNAKWAGTPLAPILREYGVQSDAVEVAFWGADTGKEKIRDNQYEQNFARSLSIADASRPDVILAWEMNGKPLEPAHGFPLRLIVPGWYGIAWVKWLSRIEVRQRRLMNRFMARDYVTIRGRRRGKDIEWLESSVGPLNVKSMIGRVTRRKDNSLHIGGAAWSQGSIRSVELKIDNGPWRAAKLDQSSRAPNTWAFWSYDWNDPSPGEHTLVSRATDSHGGVQPSADDDSIRLKKTYWEANQQYPRRIRI